MPPPSASLCAQVLAKSGPLDAQLFTIRHLLLLREEITPFDADFSAADRDLDFSHMRGHFQRLLSGEAPLFSLSSRNAVVQMVVRGGLRVLESQAWRGSGGWWVGVRNTLCALRHLWATCGH